jgi:hypothetical protein
MVIWNFWDLVNLIEFFHEWYQGFFLENFYNRIGEIPPPRRPPPPQNSKISSSDSTITHFPKSFLNVLSKIDQNFWAKNKSLLCMGRLHLLFTLDFGKNSRIEKSLPNRLVCIFTKYFAYCCKSQRPHLRSSSVTMY